MSNVDNGVKRMWKIREIENTSKHAEVMSLCGRCYCCGLVAVYAVDSYEAVVAFFASIAVL